MIIRATGRRLLRHKAGENRLHQLNILLRERREGRSLLGLLQQSGNGLLRLSGLFPERVGCQGIGHFLHADRGRKLGNLAGLSETSLLLKTLTCSMAAFVFARFTAIRSPMPLNTAHSQSAPRAVEAATFRSIAVRDFPST